jgi:nitrous oxide reductase accessory protein NosL
MNSKAIRSLLLFLCAACLVLGCDSKGDRCRKCGMLVEQHPRWIAGLTNPAGAEERFCCERCMLVHLRSPQGRGSHGAWVTEYYSQKRMLVGEVFFVAGSDVTGPMGKALVPIAGRDAAEQFKKDHYGTRIFVADELTLEVLREIAGKAPPVSPR